MNISGMEPEILSPPMALQDVWQGNLEAPGRGKRRWTASIIFTSGLFSLGGRKQKLRNSLDVKAEVSEFDKKHLAFLDLHLQT